MDVQAFYDKTVKHIRSFPRQASDSGTCCYRTTDGLSCAMGCHIPDDKYQTEMEGRVIDKVIECFPHLRELFPTVVSSYGTTYQRTLTDALQWVHDSNINWNSDGTQFTG